MVAHWLSAESWIDALGPLGEGLRDELAPGGGQEQLFAAAADDPRRLVALVGECGRRASRLALELARRADCALYPNPVSAPDTEDALAALVAHLAVCPETDAPIVVLDGPERDEALALLAPVLSRRLHPRLHVVVPCDPATAHRLSRVAGDYPRGSMLVAMVAGDAEPPPPLPASASREALLPFALTGRCPSGLFPGEDALVELGLVARHADSATTVCLLDDHNRSALVGAALDSGEDGEHTIRDILEAAPSARARALASALRWRGGAMSAPVLRALTEFTVDDLPDLRALARGGAMLTTSAVEAIVGRGRELAAEEPAGPPVGLGGATGDLEVCTEAVERHRATGDLRGLAVALEQRARLLQSLGRHDEALSSCRECLEHRRAIGNVQGQTFALYRIAQMHVNARDGDQAEAAIREAFELCERIGDRRGEAYCRWMLGALSERRADPTSAAHHYELSLAAYSEVGAVPDRLPVSLARASKAAKGRGRRADSAAGEPQEETA